MDTTPATNSAIAPEPARAPTPWGAIIGILLILAIVVAGAYYTLMERLAAGEPAAITAVE